MDKTVLVSVEIDKGDEMIKTLDRAGVSPTIALWMCTTEHEDWRLVISGPRFDALPLREGYRLLNQTLAESGFPLDSKPTVMILTKRDSFIRDLRRMFGKSKSVEGMRLGGQLFGDRFVQDAYVYRIS